MDDELKSLRIDRSKRRSDAGSKWARRWIIGGILLFAVLGQHIVVPSHLKPNIVIYSETESLFCDKAKCFVSRET